VIPVAEKNEPQFPPSLNHKTLFSLPNRKPPVEEITIINSDDDLDDGLIM
jgi:hypothetical protein